MKKAKMILAIIGMSFAFSIPKVYALEVYYKNDNGVSLSKEEYDLLTYMYWDGCQELITSDDYDKFVKSNFMNGEIGYNVYEEIQAKGLINEDGVRSLKIAKNCTSDCLIAVTLTWKGNPNVKSYDVIGTYLDGTSLSNTPTTKIGNTSYTDIKKFNNGFGVSVLLPKYNNAPVISQTFRVAKGGTVYATCQHAAKNISLADSKNYTLSKTGYGGVFKFSGIASTVYDNFGGVSISL